MKYDALLKQGSNKDKIVYSKLQDLLPYDLTAEDEEDLKKPDDEEIAKITEDTKRALEKLTHSKVTSAMPVRAAEKLAPAQYIRCDSISTTDKDSEREPVGCQGLTFPGDQGPMKECKLWIAKLMNGVARCKLRQIPWLQVHTCSARD